MKIRNLFVILFLIVFIGFNAFRFYNAHQKIQVELARIAQEQEEMQRKIREEEQRKLKLYGECLNQEYQEEMKTEEIKDLIIKVENYSKERKISYYYQNLKNDFKMSLNENTNYYGASLYKMLDIIYLINKSNAGELDLNTKLTYKKIHQKNNSLGMEKISLNSQVTIKDLLKYIGQYSDNTAHAMIVDYIGLNKLRALGRELGAVNMMDDNAYGQANTKEITIYIKKIYELIALDNDNSKLLKEILDSNYYNALNIDDINYYHKYGMWDIYYHDAGIAIGNEPYILVVMSTLRNKDYKGAFANVSAQMLKLNTDLITSQREFCQGLVYGG